LIYNGFRFVFVLFFVEGLGGMTESP